MKISYKNILYFSVLMGSSVIIDASCELVTFPVSFANENEGSVPKKMVKQEIEKPGDTHGAGSGKVGEFISEKSMPPTRPVLASEKKGSSSEGKYNLHSAITMAVSWHPEIKRAKAEAQRLKDSIDEVMASYYPNVEMGLSSGVETDNYTDEKNKTNQVNFSVEQMIYDFGSTGNRVRLSELNVISADYEVEKEINNILYQAISAYLQVVRYHQLTSAAKERIEGFNKIRDITKKRVALGASAESDYSQANLRVAEALSNYNDYISQLKKWSETLNYLINKKIASKISMKIPTEIEDVYNRVLHDNPDNIESPAIRLARTKVEIAKKQIEVQKDGHYPKVTLKPYYEYDLTAQSASNNSVRNRDRYGAFINVKVPLYQGGAVSSKVQQAKDALYSAQYNFDSEQNAARQKIMEFSSQMINTKESLKNKLEREKSAIRTRNLYMSQYLELGTRSFSDLTSAESEIHQTKADIINGNYTVSNLALESLYYAGKLINLLKA